MKLPRVLMRNNTLIASKRCLGSREAPQFDGGVFRQEFYTSTKVWGKKVYGVFGEMINYCKSYSPLTATMEQTQNYSFFNCETCSGHAGWLSRSLQNNLLLILVPFWLSNSSKELVPESEC